MAISLPVSSDYSALLLAHALRLRHNRRVIEVKRPASISSIRSFAAACTSNQCRSPLGNEGIGVVREAGSGVAGFMRGMLQHDHGVQRPCFSINAAELVMICSMRVAKMMIDNEIACCHR
jgi:hypothetical protein